MIVSIEQHIDWIARCISDLDQRGAQTIEATTEAEDEWIAHVNDVAQNTMFTAKSCNSWYLGANIPGKPRIFMPYVGGVGVYREKCDEVAQRLSRLRAERLKALSHKKIYLIAISTWFAAFGMQSVLFAWLVTIMLREPAERVGYAQMSILLPGMLLILLAGAIADRVGLRPDRRYGHSFLPR